MSILRHGTQRRPPGPHPAHDLVDAEQLPRCVACRRDGVPLLVHVAQGHELLLCLNPTVCRRNWPAEPEGAR